MAKGIDFLNEPRHELGEGPVSIQHRDIKPQNILIVGRSAVIGDFGLARILTSQSVRQTQMAGAPAYISPECISGKPGSRHADQYSLAITYYELRCGRFPFPEDGESPVSYHLQGALDFSEVPDTERYVLERATALVPDERYGSCKEMVMELRRAIRRETMPATETMRQVRTVDGPENPFDNIQPLPKTPVSNGGRGRLALAIAIGLLLLVGAGGFWQRDHLRGVWNELLAESEVDPEVEAVLDPTGEPELEPVAEVPDLTSNDPATNDTASETPVPLDVDPDEGTATVTKTPDPEATDPAREASASQQLAAASARIGRREFAPAVSELKNLLKAKGLGTALRAQAFKMLGDAFRGQESLEDAESNYGNSIAANSDYPDAYLARGRLRADQQRLTAAVDDFERYGQLATLGQEDKRILASIYMAQGDRHAESEQFTLAPGPYEKARQLRVLRNAEIDTKLGQLQQDRGRVALRSLTAATAIEAFKSAVSYLPQDPSSYRGLGDAYFLGGQHEAAIEAFTKSLELNSNQPEVRLQRATVYIATSQEEKAIADLGAIGGDRQQEVTPLLVEAYSGRGHRHLAADEVAEAITDLNAALRLAPQDPRALNYLGKAHFARADGDQAISFWERAASVSPDSRQMVAADLAIAYAGRGRTAQSSSKLESAIADFEQAIRWNPELRSELARPTFVCRFELGRKYAVAEDYRDAFAEFARIDLQPFPGSAGDKKNLARAFTTLSSRLVEQGNSLVGVQKADKVPYYQDAIQSAGEAISLDGADADRLLRRGIARMLLAVASVTRAAPDVLMKSRDFSAAGEDLKRSFSMNAKNYDACKFLGSWHMRRNEASDALPILRHAYQGSAADVRRESAAFFLEALMRTVKSRVQEYQTETDAAKLESLKADLLKLLDEALALKDVIGTSDHLNLAQQLHDVLDE